MARVYVTTCDRCGEKIDNVEWYDTASFSVVIGRKTDAAGSADDVTEDIDLCPNCAAIELEALVKNLGFVGAENWLRRVKRKA